MNNNLSVELVLEFIKSHGGKVKNSVLVPHFKKFFNDPATKEQDRLKFKEIINTVATVKVENGEKFIYLKKKFRPNNGSSKKSNTNQSESNKSPSSSTSFYSEDKPSDVAVEPKKKKQVDGVAASIKNEQANANSLNKTEIFVKPEAPPLAAPRTSPGKVSATKQPDDTTSLKSSDGSGSLSRRAKHKKSTESPNMSERRSMDVMSRLSKSSTTASGESLRQRRPMSIYQGSVPNSFERVRQNFQGKSQVDEKRKEVDSVTTSQASISSKDIEQEGDYEREPTVLLQQEKQWLLSTCKGDLVEMRKLLDEDTSLIDKKDFITGYTALHWAAKKGNRDMTQILLDMKAKVNITSNGGYTPLHLAAMSGNEEIVTLLLTAGADANLRDYSGRQPIHYLKSLSLPLQMKIFGNKHQSKPNMKGFVAGLRPRIDSIKKSSQRLSSVIGGGFGAVGKISGTSTKELVRSQSDEKLKRTSSFKSSRLRKTKGRCKLKNRPVISVMSIDEDDSSYLGESLSAYKSSKTNLSDLSFASNLSSPEIRFSLGSQIEEKIQHKTNV